MSISVSPNKSRPKIRFEYIKSNVFRTAHAHGVWAGVNGLSDLVLNFYSERTPIPKQVVHQLTDDNTLGEEVLAERVIKDTFIREVEISISMSLEVAASLRDLISKQIADYQEQKAASKKK